MNNKEYIVRVKKLETIKNDNLIFREKFNINYSIKNIRYIFNNNKLNHKLLNKNIKIAGRVINKRVFGKLTFLKIQDVDNYIQIYLDMNFISKKIYLYQNKFIDIGDIIGVEGFIFITKTNELSINCKYIYLLVKCLYPLANKYLGLLDDKIKSKKRYLDLISNRKSCNNFILRSKFIKEIRNFLHKRNFIEVETPIIQNIPGGADANPFITKYNYLKNKKLYLRIAPELYLKQLLIGGFNKIFEIGKNFRNEGLSIYHNPEFTTMEIYVTYVDFKYLIKLVEKMIKYICIKVLNKTSINFKNCNIDFNKKFNIISMKDSIYYFNNIEKNININNINDCILISKINNILIEKEWSLGRIQFEIFKKTVEKNIKYPTFITEYPIDVSPLSKRNVINSNIADRFELFICGLEIGNGFSELNDPEDQKNRFTNQKLENNNSIIDKEYIDSMKYGLPISSGVGIGIDRLIMILTNSNNIKDIILFPNIRYKDN
ncbi:lysine--tRNA ligase [endosymbiont of Pachyrhynchus infernalis]|uniref:lysine--tRNA ligase n=1 Tax=endosymbiont of Pachyrhynchus infernalis TaxID=1971488 RepID=UPI000DC6EF72|nr:lysine--tRNA ligase [endosymbiont of Pachyrhynchus infernalis]BBA84754.1 lysine--tRNA ligase [endosymbiont of Pachyrhynchus infernalis]